MLREERKIFQKSLSSETKKMFILRGEFEFFCETTWQKSIVIK